MGKKKPKNSKTPCVDTVKKSLIVASMITDLLVREEVEMRVGFLAFQEIIARMLSYQKEETIDEILATFKNLALEYKAQDEQKTSREPEPTGFS